LKNTKYWLASLAICLVTVSFTHAQATRTWVSGVGDDVNPCSRTAPCKTFAGAISKTAAGGEIDALDPGGFGGVTITKSITIDGGAGQVGSVLVGSNGVTINAGANDVVTLRNLSINGAFTGLNGVQFLQARALHIENCAIFGFTLNGINIQTSSPAEIFINRTVSRDNSENGVFFQGTMPSVLATVSDSHFENNASGLVAGSYSKVTVRDSTASGNSGAGFQALATSGPSSMSLVTSTTANNGGPGVQAGGSGPNATIRITGITDFSNASALSTTTGGGIYSYGNNYLTGAGAPTATIAAQ
jgi:hypothetical protein